MAYAAVTSLKLTIDGLLNSPRFSGVFSTNKILKSAHFQAKYLQQVLEKSNGSSRSRRSRERLDALEGLIRDSAYKLEDVLESFELNPEEASNYGDDDVRREIASFTKKVKKMETDYIRELSSPETEEDGKGDDEAAAAAAALSNIDTGVQMVGRSDAMSNTRDELLSKMRPDDSVYFLLLGGRGSGRSIVAKTIYGEFCEGKGKRFERCAWVTAGTGCEPKHVLISIIAQIDGLEPGCEQLLVPEEEEKLAAYLYNALEEKAHMIVLDDVHDLKLVECLRKTLPATNNGSVVVVTTHLDGAAGFADCVLELEPYSPYFQLGLWSYLRVPSSDAPLEEAARKVLENCRGHYVSALKAFLLLMKTERTAEEWSKIAADTENPVFMVADEIKEINEIEREVQYSFKHNWLVDDTIRRIIRKIILERIHLPMVVEEVKRLLYPTRFFSKSRIMSIFGMAGLGKSNFVRNILKDNSIVSRFDCHAWIPLGPRYESGDILVDILATIYPNHNKLHMKDNMDLVKELCAQLCTQRCLIVLDDLWSAEPLHHLRNLFPNIKGIIIVTTRQVGEGGSFADDKSCYQMQLLDKEESWSLLCQKVFGGGEWPLELEKAGHKIAENCDGLPLLILKVGDELREAEISEEFWNNVASGKEKSIFINAHRQISSALLPSFQILSQHLKAYFLYMGIFREKYEIPTYKLTNLYIAEGFLEPNPSQVIEDFVAECLFNLGGKSLVMEQHESYGLQRKRCRLHAVFWHLSNSEAMKSKFFQAMNCYDDCSLESIKDQRRLCIRNNILLGIKDVKDSMSSNTKAHSLMCVGPFHRYSVPFNFDMRLLRVLNARTIRLYEFPTEVVNKVQLRYLSLTCNGKLPASMSNLWKLQCLIVKRYMNVKSSKETLLLPVEIWDMKELKHLEVMGGHLPDHKCGAGLLELSALLDVSVQNCREEVLKWIPNLKRLGIRIELTPEDEGSSFHYLNNISSLHKLESLKCVVVNPRVRSNFIPPILTFPSGLKRLSLSGLAYPWEYMSKMGDLKNLEVLKLKNYAFQGPQWEMDFDLQFKNLQFLVIQDTNLVHWKTTSIAIAESLRRLSIKHCYKLQELPSAFPIQGLKLIEIVDCNALTQAWARKTAHALISYCEVKVALSWVAGAVKNHS